TVGPIETVGLRSQTHLLHQREAGVGDHQQGVLLGRVHGHAVFAGHRGIHEFDDDVGADTLDPAIAPLLEGVSGGGAAALFRGTLIAAAGGVRFDLVGGPEGDVDTAAVALPARDARGVTLIGVGDATVVFLF